MQRTQYTATAVIVLSSQCALPQPDLGLRSSGVGREFRIALEKSSSQGVVGVGDVVVRKSDDVLSAIGGDGMVDAEGYVPAGESTSSGVSTKTAKLCHSPC